MNFKMDRLKWEMPGYENRSVYRPIASSTPATKIDLFIEQSHRQCQRNDDRKDPAQNEWESAFRKYIECMMHGL